MSEEWLHIGENNRIPFRSRMIIEQMIHANQPFRFDNTEYPTAGTIPSYGGAPYSWVVRVFAPASLGGRVELFVSDSEDEYEVVCDQITRYIRHLMKLYPEYKPLEGGTI